MEKVKMTSARNVSYSIVEAGRNAVMSKMDIKDAYKIIPAPVEELRLQGFCVMGKFFVETQQMFGSIPSVANFDRTANTIVKISEIESGIDPRWIHRQLDDTCVISPAEGGGTRSFSESYINTCKDIHVPLAEICCKKEKAFFCSTQGRILGIDFDTATLSWRLPESKRLKTLAAIECMLNDGKSNLETFQKLMGRLNDVSLMCPFLNGFKRPLNDVLGELQNSSSMVCLDVQTKKDLLVWAGFLSDKETWNPIAHRPSAPPLYRKEFTSDAAGAGSVTGGEVGCGNVGFNEKGELFFATQLFWDSATFLTKTDEKGASFKHKTTTLEMVGIMLPFLLIPEQLTNQHVIVKVDNMGCFFGWENRSARGDKTASVLIRTLHMIAAYLGCVIHIRHLPRMSSWDAKLADRLSRKATTSKADKEILDSFKNPPIPKSFQKWLINPSENFDLAEHVLANIENKFEKNKK
jgi:hypothetical protein